MADLTSSGRTNDLVTWQLARLEALRALRYTPSTFSQVTALAYHYWDDARSDPQFDFVESAIYETWLRCGKLKTCLVINKATPRIEAFASHHGDVVTIQVSSALVPGDLPSMSIDCNANLHRYFDTEYVLVIQNDGFPLREGLGAFLGSCDYVGAPYVRKTARNRVLGLWPHFAVGNGGFSLRTKNICERASYYWARRYHRMPRMSRFVREDAFYCFVLPLLERAYRKKIRFASWEVARHFAYDSLCDESLAALPFGFHGKDAFKYLVDSGLFSAEQQGQVIPG